MDDIRTIYCNLPNTIKGFTVSTPDGYFTIVLNQNLSYEQNMISYTHEMEHIMNRDFESKCSAGMIEIMAHGL